MEDVSKKDKNYVEAFEEKFKIHIQKKEDDNPVLYSIKERYEESIYRKNEFRKQIYEIKLEIKAELEHKFGKECKELIDQLCYFEKVDRDEIVDKAFGTGYTVAEKFKDELKKAEGRLN